MLLHGVFSGPFLLAWELEPFVTSLLICAAGFYLLGLRRIASQAKREVPGRYPVYFYLGLAVMALALIGPLDAFNENSFTLHMGQHVTMMLIAAPLLVLGRPAHIALWAMAPRRSGAIVRPVLRRRWLRLLLDIVTHPLVVLLLVTVNLIVWHLPDFYVAALDNDLIHELEHGMFLGTALLFWWVIIDPVPRHHKVRPDYAIAMLFVAGAVGDLLSLYILFSPEVLYSYYLVSETIWGLSQHADQRIGGLVMLLTGTIVYFGATILLIVTNYGDTRTAAGETSPALSTHD